MHVTTNTPKECSIAYREVEEQGRDEVLKKMREEDYAGVVYRSRSSRKKKKRRGKEVEN